MKKLIFLFLILFLFPSIALSEMITLEWDYSAEDQAKIDGFKLFMKKRYQDSYDYNNPILTIPASDRTANVEAPAAIDAVQGYNWVIRAYKEAEESTDSNQVEYYVVGKIPATPINLTGEYNKETSLLYLSWEQPQDDYDIWQWIVYYRLTDQSDFTELGRVDKGQALTLTKDFDAVANGESETVYFTVVSFRRDYTIHSPNSVEFSLLIDRSGPPIAPDNLKINIEIPVP